MARFLNKGNSIRSRAGAILGYFPKPTAAGTADGINNYVSPPRPSPETYYTTIGRFDHNIGDRQRIYFRAAWMDRLTGPYRSYWDGPAVGNLAPVRLIQPAIDDV